MALGLVLDLGALGESWSSVGTHCSESGHSVQHFGWVSCSPPSLWSGTRYQGPKSCSGSGYCCLESSYGSGFFAQGFGLLLGFKVQSLALVLFVGAQKVGLVLCLLVIQRFGRGLILSSLSLG